MKMTAVLILATLSFCFALDTARVAYTQAAIAIDGLLNEQAWAQAETLHTFQFPWGPSVYNERSRVKLLWDDSAFYIGAIMDDNNIIAAVTSGTGIDGDDMFETHIAPDAAHPEYFYVAECNLNKIFRSRIRQSNANGTNLWFETWNIPTLSSGVVLHGIKNSASARDTSWGLEMRVPFSLIMGWKAVGAGHAAPTGWSAAVPPAAGSLWRYNVCRQDVNVSDDANAEWSLWSHNGNYPLGPTGIQLHDQNNFGVLLFTKPLAIERGAHQQRTIAHIEAWPNPFSGKVALSLPRQAECSLIDIRGKCVARFQATAQTPWVLDAGMLAPGVYTVQALIGGKRLAKRISVVR